MSRASLILAALAAGCGGGTVELSAAVADACPVVAVADDRAIVDEVRFDRPRTLELWVENRCRGRTPLELGPITVDGDPAFSAPRGTWRLLPGEQLALPITFAPTTYGSRAAAVRVQTNDPAQPEIILAVQGSAAEDQDLDGFRAREVGGEDCDDRDASRYPGKTEARDGVDQDCDGLVDEDFVEAGDVMITEILTRPSARPPARGAWVEVVNTTPGPVDLGGWTLSTGGRTLTVQGRVRVRAGERAWLSTGATVEDNGIGEPGGVLAGEPLDPSGAWELLLQAQDRVVFVLEGDEALVPPEGASIQLDATIDDPFQAARADLWCPSDARMPNGDRGTPGVDNALCPGVDHDGDGWSLEDGDCDDFDPDRHPGAAERFNRIDDDCGGLADDFVLGRDLAGGTFTDRTSATDVSLGSGDLDGDGVDEVVAATVAGNPRVITIWRGDQLDEIDGDATRDRLVQVDIGLSYAARVPRELRDLDDDGQDDLILLTSSGSGQASWTMWSGLPDDGDDLDDADLRIASRFFLQGDVATIDLDGDGINEAALGDTPSDGTRGRVTLVDASQVGSLDLEDVQIRSWRGDTFGERAGTLMGVGDLNGDGYEDLAVVGADTPARLHVIAGGSRLPSSGTLDDRADWFTDLAFRQTAPIGTGPLLQDVDDDGHADIVLGEPNDGRVALWTEAWDDPGRLDSPQRQIGLGPLGGCGLAAGDPAGSGVTTLAVGGDTAGWVYLYDDSEIARRSVLDARDALGGVEDDLGQTRLGCAILFDDVDGRPGDDLVLTSFDATTFRHRLWFLPGD